MKKGYFWLLIFFIACAVMILSYKIDLLMEKLLMVEPMLPNNKWWI